MKGKLFFTNALMGLMILFAIIFQSLHAIEHLAKQFSEEKCHHAYNHHHTEIGHGHDGLEKCFVCEFAFGGYTATPVNALQLQKIAVPTSYHFCYSKEITQRFRGSLFALRAPPGFIA